MEMFILAVMGELKRVFAEARSKGVKILKSLVWLCWCDRGTQGMVRAQSVTPIAALGILVPHKLARVVRPDEIGNCDTTVPTHIIVPIYTRKPQVNQIHSYIHPLISSDISTSLLIHSLPPS